MQLKAHLPDHLYWLTEKVESLVRPAAFLIAGERHRKTRVPVKPAPLGGTFTDGEPDIPALAPWAAAARSVPARAGTGWMSNPYDGESFVLQLNLQDIPAEVRPQYPDLPAVGVVWVTIDLSCAARGWKGYAYFDPRPAASIEWEPRRADGLTPAASQFVLQDSLTCATDYTLPEIASDWREGGLAHDYDNWWQDHYGGRSPSSIQLGGWMNPIQGDHDELRKTLLVAMEQREFGDNGAVYLHYSAEQGFFVHVETH